MAEPRIIERYGSRSAWFPEAGDEFGNRVLCRLVRPELPIGGGSNACAHRSDDTEAGSSEVASVDPTSALLMRVVNRIDNASSVRPDVKTPSAGPRELGAGHGQGIGVRRSGRYYCNILLDPKQAT